MKPTKPGYEQARILITVKTYPTPSQHHVETVCVAGVRIDQSEPSWIRLYPIAFRTLSGSEQFKKYQIVDVPIVSRGSTDCRPESYSPDMSQIEMGAVIDTKKNWAKRAALMGPLIGATTTCDLVAINRATPMNMPAPSLGLVKPEVRRIEPLPFAAWKPNQLKKVQRASEPDLFNTPLAELQPVPYRFKVHYKCMSDGCAGHKQEIIDWELGVAGILWKKNYGSETGKKLTEKWESILMDSTKDLHIYIGNQHQYRHSFSILGAYYPKLD